MNFVKILNGKAVSTDEINNETQSVPDGTYIAATLVDGEIRFYGTIEEDGLIDIANTVSTNYSGTIAEAKSVIKSIGCLFLNGIEVSL
jgi:hypothetical protein